jgi:hypothetical protein
MLPGLTPYAVLAVCSAACIPLTVYLARHHCTDTRCILGMYTGVAAFGAWIGAYLLRALGRTTAGVALSIGGACLALVFLAAVYRYYPSAPPREQPAARRRTRTGDD